ncbi:hypothetical protein KRP22_012391 [Phytophthora ramorum]|nr:hypothetical protein KRP22_774 [Phytophthora ramorum]
MLKQRKTLVTTIAPRMKTTPPRTDRKSEVLVFLRRLFDKMTPSNRRLPDPSKVPAHLRPLRLNADG